MNVIPGYPTTIPAPTTVPRTLRPNECKTKNPMSLCGCNGDYAKCFHGDKGRFKETCMYWRFEEYCDSVVAQSAAT
jgi:hypothetical protein